MYIKKLIFSLFVSVSLFGRSEDLSFTRVDGSQAVGYINIPENIESFPLVVYIDGSLMQSVKNNFTVLSYLFEQKHIGTVALEKRGIEQDFYEYRLNDYSQLISQLHQIAPGWDGQIIFIGSSEGGKIAPALSLQYPDMTKATILIGSGGGLPFGEEIKYQIKQIAIENGIEFNEKDLDTYVDYRFALMLEEPHSLEKFYDKTYQWYASYLNYNLLGDLLQVNTPILMIHGVQDSHIPVASADLVKESFDAINKDNLTYLRVDDLGHSISKRMDIFMLLLNYSDEYFRSKAVVGL